MHRHVGVGALSLLLILGPMPVLASDAPAADAPVAQADSAVDGDASTATDVAEAPSIGGVIRTDEPPNRSHRSEIIALSTVAGLALAGGGVFLGMAHTARNERDAIEGDLLFDRHQRTMLQLDQRTNQIAAYALIGTGLLAAAGLTYVLVTRNDDSGADVSLSPSVQPGGAGMVFGARW